MGILDPKPISAAAIAAQVGNPASVIGSQLTATIGNVDANEPARDAPALAANNGKNIQRGYTSTGKLVSQLSTEINPMGYTSFELFPATDESRAKVSFWHKSPDSLAVGEQNKRPLSIEMHGAGENGGGYETTLYTQLPAATAQNGAIPAQPFQGKAFQWNWGPNWENRLQMIMYMHAVGYIDDTVWGSQGGVHIGKLTATRPVIFLGTGTAAEKASIDVFGGALQLIPGTGGIKLKGATTVTSGSFNVIDVGVTARFASEVPAPTGTNGVFLGRKNSDQGQPVIWLSNGTDTNTAEIDQRLGKLRLIVNGTIGLQVETGKIGFYGVAPVARAAAIASPAADVTALKTAVDALRVALTNVGITS